MSDSKTAMTEADVAAFLANVAPARRQQDALALDALFRRVTGWQPRMWGASMVGYGVYDYTYDSGHSGRAMATGFAPRKAHMVIYIMPGYADFSQILGRLGPHKLGKACLYLGSLAKVDQDVLAELISAGLKDLGKRWEIAPT